MLFNHLKYKNVVWIGTRVSIFLMAVFDVSPGIHLRHHHKRRRNKNTTTSADLSKTTSSAFKKQMGRTNFFMFIKCSHHVSNSLVRLYQTMETQVMQPYSISKNFCLKMLLSHKWSLAKVVITLSTYRQYARTL